eukprot:768150-Hanusia_phi.AAC.2
MMLRSSSSYPAWISHPSRSSPAGSRVSLHEPPTLTADGDATEGRRGEEKGGYREEPGGGEQLFKEEIMPRASEGLTSVVYEHCRGVGGNEKGSEIDQI